MTADLFTPIKLGDLELPNRIVMGPMTRLRAQNNGTPTAVMAEYYAQRATAGLIITECTMVGSLSHGYLYVPGIYNATQIEAWKNITTAVHGRGGRIFLQIWHCGRVAHSSLLDEALPIAPSAIPAEGSVYTPIGKVPLEKPREMRLPEIMRTVKQFGKAAQNAQAAGFDGVEIHGAFGYLIDQFLQDVSNQRTDKYGGSLENRLRFLTEVVTAVCKVWGGDRVGIKLSPSNTFHGMQDSDPLATFSGAIQALNSFNLAYIHLMEPNEQDLATRDVIRPVIDTFGPQVTGAVMANGGFDKESASSAIAKGQASLVSFARKFLANPDLPKRFELGAPLNEPNPSTFYGKYSDDGDNAEVGYTDYPALA
ncbi:MAG: alkene reductase [Cyanobacteria bacterium P01_H01_bin.15]